MDIKKLTVGIEEEYQVINPETGELTSYIAEFLERDAVLFKDSMVPEFLQSQLEVTSKVCKNIQQAKKEVIRLRKIACLLYTSPSPRDSCASRMAADG